MIIISKLRITTLALILVAASVQADDAGSVLFSKGSVTAQRDTAVALAKGDLVQSSDTIATGDASRAQLLMIDGAKIAIRPNSEIRIDEYAYAAASSTIVEEANDKSVLSLVKGGFRTITGAIGEEDRSNYEVRTPVGVLGIRGTNFAILLCGGDCNWAPNVNPGEPIEDGLYIGVTEGVIEFRAQGGNIVVRAGEYAFIPLGARAPERLDSPPAVLIDGNDLRFDADGSAAQSGFDSKLGTRRSPDSSPPDADGSSSKPGDSTNPEAPKQPVIGIDADGTPIDITPGEPPSPNGRTIGYATGPMGASGVAFSGTQFNDPGLLQLDAGNNVTGFDGPYPGRALDEPATWDIGTSSNTNVGFDTMTVLRWGRWSDGVANGILQSDGSDVSIDLANQSLHWISGPDAAPPVMPITGTASYSLIGATAPTDNFGNTGVLGSATFFADFTNLVVDSTLAIDIGGVTWSAAGSGTFGEDPTLPPYLFAGTYGAVIVGGVTSGSGEFSGFFSAPGATSNPTFPGGVGLTYSLQDGQSLTTVSGAAAFGNP
jgi:hypothetical protein